jgi:hypothetical protein
MLDVVQASGKEAIVYCGAMAFGNGGYPAADAWIAYVKSELGAGADDADGFCEYIVKYYAQKYGDKLDGWWFDGSNQLNETQKQNVKDAVRSGNPNAVVTFGTHAMNDYFGGHATLRTIADHWSYDYNYRMITDIEAGPFTEVVDGVFRAHHYPVDDPADSWGLKHNFLAMQPNWTIGNLAFPDWQAVDWCSRSVAAGGFHTWSIPTDYTGSKLLGPQFDLCRKVNAAIEGAEFLHDSFETDFGAWIDGEPTVVTTPGHMPPMAKMP